MKLYIQNMVSLRCIMKVEEELRFLKMDFVRVDLGSIEFAKAITEEQRSSLGKKLEISGLQFVEEKNGVLIEKIKTAIIELIHHSENVPRVNYSDYLAEKLGYNYTYLSNTFCKKKGVTIQQFIINHKIEKVKQLLLNKGNTLTEIAHRLDYSSVSHLSNQFKKIAGFTPSVYRNRKTKGAQNLEKL